MAEKEIKKVSTVNTKQEILAVYNQLLKQLQEKDSSELRPQAEVEKKRIKEAVEVAEALSTEGVMKGIGVLRTEINALLNRINDSLDLSVSKYRKVQEAVSAKEKELQEIFAIEKAAQTLAALIEAHSQKSAQFEKEMQSRRNEFNMELEKLRSDKAEEEALSETGLREKEANEARLRQREKEDYDYNFKREKQAALDKLLDEKMKLEKEYQAKKEAVEKQLKERELAVASVEQEFSELKARVNNLPKEIEFAVQKAVKETAEKIRSEAQNREAMLDKSFEGERNVLTMKAESLEKTAKDQKEQLVKLYQQLDKAYEKIESMAVSSLSSGYPESPKLQGVSQQ